MVPLNQAVTIATYIMKQKLKGNKRYPLVLMLEPLFRCNLACSGCGKIDYPNEILNQRISACVLHHRASRQIPKERMLLTLLNMCNR